MEQNSTGKYWYCDKLCQSTLKYCMRWFPRWAKPLSSAARAEILHDLHRLLCLCSVSISQLSLEDRSALLSSSTLTRSVRWLAKLTATVASAGRWFQELSESVKYWIQTCVEETWNCSGRVKAEVCLIASLPSFAVSLDVVRRCCLRYSMCDTEMLKSAFIKLRQFILFSCMEASSDMWPHRTLDWAGLDWRQQWSSW